MYIKIFIDGKPYTEATYTEGGDWKENEEYRPSEAMASRLPQHPGRLHAESAAAGG